MSDKQTRGKPSKVDLLPNDIQKTLIQGLRDKSITQTDLLESINNMIDGAGLPEDMQLSRSGLNRYSTKMEERGARMRQAREVSKQWTEQFGEMPESDIGKITREIVKTLGFEVGAAMIDGDPEKINPKTLNQLALLSKRLEEAESQSLKREKEIRKIIAEEAAEKAEGVARSAGMSEDKVDEIKAQILGLK